jgi:hypothetical protein
MNWGRFGDNLNSRPGLDTKGQVKAAGSLMTSASESANVHGLFN